MVICLERGADLHMAQLTPLPLTVSCFRKIQTGSTFLVSAHPGSAGRRAVKRVCVCCVHTYQIPGTPSPLEDKFENKQIGYQISLVIKPERQIMPSQSQQMEQFLQQLKQVHKRQTCSSDVTNVCTHNE